MGGVKLNNNDNQIAQKPGMPPMIVLFIGILGVSSASIFIRFAQQEASSLVIAAYRMLISALVLAPIALSKQLNEIKQLNRKQLLFMLLSGFFLALHFASWITSLEYTTVVSSVVIVASVPIWVALVSPLFLKERVSLMLWVGLVVAFVGGVVIGGGQSCHFESGRLLCPSFLEFTREKYFFGNLLALGGAMFGAAYLVIGKQVRAKVSLLSYTFLVYGTAAILLLVLVFAAKQPMFGFSFEIYIWFLFLALVPQMLGHTSFNWALKHLSATYVSIACLGEPIGSAILAYFLLQEVPTAIELFGSVLILVGIYMASISENSSQR